MENSELKSKIKITGTTNKALSGVFKRKQQQVWTAINTNYQPALRKKIINYVEHKLERQSRKVLKKK